MLFRQLAYILPETCLRRTVMIGKHFTQEELDNLWEKLSEGGGEVEQCG